MKIVLLSVGKLKGDWEQIEKQLLKQMSPYYNVEEIILKDSKEKVRDRARQSETEELLKRLEKYSDYKKVLLDEKGKSFTSINFANWVEQEKITGKILFIIGGPWGVTDELRNKVDKKIQLSEMTLTHEMAKVLLLEQLFRAVKINQNSSYHK